MAEMPMSVSAGRSAPAQLAFRTKSLAAPYLAPVRAATRGQVTGSAADAIWPVLRGQRSDSSGRRALGRALAAGVALANGTVAYLPGWELDAAAESDLIRRPFV